MKKMFVIKDREMIRVRDITELIPVSFMDRWDVYVLKDFYSEVVATDFDTRVYAEYKLHRAMPLPDFDW